MSLTQGANERTRRQYAAWGLVVQTGTVRAVHIANGIVQLLRLLPTPPQWQPALSDPKEYVRAVTSALSLSWRRFRLTDPAKALCVVRESNPKRQRSLVLDGTVLDPPPFYTAGLEHIRGRLTIGGQRSRFLDAAMHHSIASALNADGRVYSAGGEDITTPYLYLAGCSSPHTLNGMHATTLLGLLTATEAGCEAVATLHRLLRRRDDPHSRLIDYLGVAAEPGVELRDIQPKDILRAYPCPTGPGWSDLADLTARLTRNLLTWCDRGGVSKADTLMGLVDLASLLLFMRLLRWGGDRLILLVAQPPWQAPRYRHLESDAETSLRRAFSALDQRAQGEGIQDKYPASRQAGNIGAAGGWVFPSNAGGGARRRVRPSARQLMTLTYAVVEPGRSMPWSAFSKQVEALGLAIGGHDEHAAQARLGLPGASGALRAAGDVNRAALVALGLARQESDNVVVVDGGGR